MAGYDSVAWFYDRLAAVVYGRTLVRAQEYLLDAIPQNARILIAGGGTGWILEKIATRHASGLSIVYAEPSVKMMERARKRNCGHNGVSFVDLPVEDLPVQEYDIIFTALLFDNMDEALAQRAFEHMHAMLASGGLWLYCDYRDTGVWWHRLLLKAMYLFFRALRAINAQQLPDMEACFSAHHYVMRREKTFFKKFVVSRVYEKQ